MRVAMLQVASPDEETIEARRERVSRLIEAESALGATDLLVLPELWGVGAFNYRGFAAAAEPLEGPTLALARGWATTHGLVVHAGSIVEKAADDALFNTSLLIDRGGQLLASYRKVHLFGAHEARELSAGDELAVPAIDGTTMGLATCYDLRFPELFRSMVDAGATVALLASGWPDARVEHWRLLTAARAVEDQMYVVGCNAVGTHSGTVLAGASRVIDPWGTVVAESGAEEGFTYAEIDADLPGHVRTSFPAVSQRRWHRAPTVSET
ncbi:MAG: carbon-nitrogen family hydrolase [Marmoricola sp.]